MTGLQHLPYDENQREAARGLVFFFPRIGLNVT
jgi:hypothetical protein